MPRNSNVDERIVEMRIDNKNFESGAKKTISTLEKLDKALKFKSGSNALDDLEKSVNKFDTSNMTKGIEKVQMSFSALEIAGMRVISNLTDSIMNFATKTAKALTIDQVSAGWNKYEKMIESTQTIMAATQNMIGKDTLDDGTAAILDKTLGVYRDAQGALTGFVDQASQMQVVQDYLDGLLWFADETSYSFNDMTDNMGKFLSAGVDIESAYKSMMGVASWGATAGAKPAEVSRALYNISQAMGSGAMKNIDWRSIENANMATLGFKQTAIEVAESMGKLQHVTSELTGKKGFVGMGVEVNDAGYIVKKTDEEVEDLLITAENFRESLQSGWFDKEVMQEVFSRYGMFAEQLKESTEATDVEATGLLQVLDKYRKAEDAEKFWQNYAKSANLSVEQLKTLREEIGKLDAIGLEYDFSEQGFRRGQEAKTFTDAIEATKDAVSSKWMETFKYIFGDYLQAKTFWTQATEELYNMFAAGGDVRNEVLEAWAEVDEFQRSGRDYLLGIEYDDEGEVKFKGALWNLLDAVHSVTDPIHDAFTEAFGLDDTASVGHALRELTKRFQEFTSQLGFSKEAGAGIKSAFKAVFTVLRGGLKIVGTGITVISKFAAAIGNVVDGAIALASGQISLSQFFERIGESIVNILPTEEKLLEVWENIKTKYNDITTAIQNGTAWETIKSYLPSWQTFNNLISSIAKQFQEKYPQIFEMFNRWKEQHTIFGSLIDLITGGFSKIDGFLKSINIDTSKVSQVFSEFGAIVSNLFNLVFGDPGELSQKVQEFFSAVVKGLNNSIKEWKAGDLFNAIRTAGFAVLLVHIGELITSFKSMTKEFTTIGGAVKNVLGDAGLLLNDIGKSFRANAFIKMAAAFAILAASLVALTFVNPDKLTHVIVTMGLLVGVLTLFMNSMGGFDKLFGDKKANNQLSGNKITLFNNFASILIGFAALLGTIAMVLMVARKTNPKMLVGVLLGVVGLFVALALITKGLGKIEFNNGKAVIGSILMLSLALDAMLPVLIAMALMPINRYLQAIFGVMVMLASLGGVLALLDHWKVNGSNLTRVTASMAILALALNMLIPIFAVLGVFSGAAIGRGFVGLLALLGVLIGVTAALNALKINGKNMLAIAASMTLVAMAVNLLMPAISILGAGITALVATIPWQSLMNKMGGFRKAFWKLLGLAGLAVVFSVAVIAVGAGILALGTGMILAAAGAVGLTLALVPLAGAFTVFIKTISEIEGVSIGKILALAAGFVAIGLAVGGTVWALNKLLGNKGIGSKLGAFIGSLTSKFGGICKTVTDKLQEAFPQILQMLGGLLIMAGLYFMGIIPDLTKILVGSIIELFNSLANEVESNREALVSSIMRIIRTALGIAGDILGELFSADFLSSLTVSEKLLFGVMTALAGIKAVSSTMNLAKPFAALTSMFGGAAGAGEAAAGGAAAAASAGKWWMAAGAGLGEFGGAATLATAGLGGLLAALGLVPAIMADNKMSADYTAQALDGMGSSVQDLALKANELASIQREGEAALYDYTGTATVSYQESRYAAETYKQVVQDLATQLGLSTSEIYAQIAAADGDVTKIAALTESTKDLSGVEQQRADQMAARRGEIDQAASSVGDTITSVEQLKTSMDGLDPEAMMSKFNGMKIDPSVLGDLGFGEWFSANQEGFTIMGQDIIAGISQGLNTGGETLPASMSQIANALPPAFKSVLGIESPSTVMAAAAAEIPAGVELGITQNSGAATGAISSLAYSMLSAASTIFSSDGPSHGASAVYGLVNGINSNLQLVYDAGVSAGNAFMQGYDNATDTHSPSREMFLRGIYAIQGLVGGLHQNQDDVYSEASGLGYGMIQTLQNAMSQVAMLAMNEFEFNPVITPVVDLTNINAATGSINGAFSGTRIGLSGEISSSVFRRLDQAERVASSMEARTQTINNTGDNITFNIYASEGMDENAIADAVMSKMQTRMVRRSAAFG